MAEANHDRISFGMDRATKARSPLQSPVGDGDDCDLAAMGISDGFRPTAAGPAGPGRTTSLSSQRQRRSTPPPRPSSATKPRNLDNSAVRHDGAMEALPRPVATASTSSAGSITRSSSSSTDLPFARAESPYQGPAGPSHPYHMYTQNTRLARTASVATTSTVPALSERSYIGPSGPTHPYGMYPQNIVAEAEGLHDDVSVSGIPVGFPGHGGAYQRRLGLDGEEVADIIGPLGHTEQLPPYTRYPENVLARKATHVLPHLPGAGGIGLATRNPEFASREDLNAPLSTQSFRHSMTSDSDHQINTVAVASSEKPPEKKWKIVAARKVCGIVPLWVFFVVGVIFLVLIIILGAVLVVISHRHNWNSSSPKSSSTDAVTGIIYATVTTTYDASPLSTVPPGIPALPTGTFMLPIASPSIQQSTCLDKNILDAAWSCNVPPDSIEMTVTPLAGSASNGSGNRVTLSGNSPSAFFYGSQPPKIDPNVILILVNDAEQTSLGPAWYFQVLYDKVVVLPESDLPSPLKTKRNKEQRSYGDRNSKAVAQNGDRPWFCHWGGTILETFIYVNQTSESSGNQQAAPTTTLSTYARTVSTATAELPTATVVVGSSGSKSQSPLYNFPNIVKVEERRDPIDKHSKAPYCVQMFIRPDDTAAPSVNDDGELIVIYLNETEPTLTFSGTKRGESDLFNVPAAPELMERGDTDIQHMCRCVWFT